MKHTYEKPVITVDAGMAEGVYAASGAPTTQIRKCSLPKQIIFLRQHPIPMLPLLLFFPFFRPLPLFFFLLFHHPQSPAQAGGKNPEKIDEAVAKAAEVLEGQIA